jgi:hypothetical protein
MANTHCVYRLYRGSAKTRHIELCKDRLYSLVLSRFILGKLVLYKPTDVYRLGGVYQYWHVTYIADHRLIRLEFGFFVQLERKFNLVYKFRVGWLAEL